MKRQYALVLLALAMSPMAAWAEHANIKLELIRANGETGQVKQTSAFADQEPPLGGVNPRPLAKVKANEPLILEFILTNTYPHGDKPNVTVRYYVVREDKIRQKTVPDLSQGVVMQGKFKMNFKPQCKVGARIHFRIPEEGIYLLRVETLNTDSDHEHFSAIDIKVK